MRWRAAIAGVVALAGGTLDPTAMPLAEANLDEPVFERNQFTRSWLRWWYWSWCADLTSVVLLKWMRWLADGFSRLCQTNGPLRVHLADVNESRVTTHHPITLDF